MLFRSIQEAVTFYSKNGDEYRKMLAQYYLGNAYYRKENYSACISLYFSSLKLAEKLNDHFWIAMCSRGISDVYNNTFNGSEELVYAKKEYENFLKTGKTSHIDYAVLDLCRAYNNNNLYDSCENRLKALIDTAIKRNDDYLLYETQKCLGLTYLRKHDYRANFKIVKSVCASHYGHIVIKLCLRNKNLSLQSKTDCDGKEPLYRAGGMSSARRNG